MPKVNWNPDTKLDQAPKPIKATVNWTEPHNNPLVTDIYGQATPGVGTSDFGKSQYDTNIPYELASNQENLENIRGESQTRLDKWGNAIPRLISKATIETLKTPGYLYAIGEAIATDNNLAQSLNNAWINRLEQGEQLFKDEFPIYTPKAVREGNLWDNLTSHSFWTNEGIDGAGFMLGLLAPGAGLKALGLGAKAAKLTGQGAKFAEGVDLASATLMNTTLESAAEAKGLADSLKIQLTGQINPKTNLEYTQEEIDNIAGNAAKNSFLTNFALLLGPDFITNKNILGKAVPSRLGKYVDEAGNFKNLDEITKRSFLKDYGTNLAKSAFNEGFVEEAGQFAIEDYNKKLALGQTDSPYLIGLIESYADALTTTEGQKSILLGKVLGGLGAYRGTKSERKERQEESKIISMLKDNFEGFSKRKTDSFQRDESGKVILDETGNPIPNHQSNAETIAEIAKESLHSNIKDIYDELGNQEAVDFLSNQDYTRTMIPYFRVEDQGLDGLDILNKNIDALNNEYYKSEGNQSTSLKTKLEANRAAQKELTNKLYKQWKSINKYIDNYAFSVKESNIKELPDFLDKVKSASIQEVSKQYYLNDRITSLSNEVFSLENSIEGSLPQTKVDLEAKKKQLELYKESLADSYTKYNDLFGKGKLQKAFEDYTDIKQEQAEIIKEEETKVAEETQPGVTTTETNTEIPEDLDSQITSLTDRITKLKEQSDLAESHGDQENSESLYEQALELEKQLEELKKSKEKSDKQVAKEAEIKTKDITREFKPGDKVVYNGDDYEIESIVPETNEVYLKGFDNPVSIDSISKKELTQSEIDAQLQELTAEALGENTLNSVFNDGDFINKNEYQDKESNETLGTRWFTTSNPSYVMNTLFNHSFHKNNTTGKYHFKFQIDEDTHRPTDSNTANVDFNTLNNPDLVKIGDEIRFVKEDLTGKALIEFTEKNKFSDKILLEEGYTQEEIDSVRQPIAIYHSKTNARIGFLQALRPLNPNSEVISQDKSKAAQKALFELRKNIIDKLNNNESVVSSIDNKGSGALYVLKSNDKPYTEGKFLLSNDSDNIINTRDKDKINGLNIFVQNKDGKVNIPIIEASNIDNQLHDLQEAFGYDTKHEGLVYMAVKSANNIWRRIPVYATKINDKTADKIVEILGQYTNSKDIISKLNPYIFSTFKEDKKFRSYGIKLIKDNKGKVTSFIINSNNYRIENLNNPKILANIKADLKTYRHNIDTKNINTKAGQKLLAEYEMITTNARQYNGEWYVMPMVTFDYKNLISDKVKKDIITDSKPLEEKSKEVNNSFQIEDLIVRIENIKDSNFTYEGLTKTLTINSDIIGKLRQGHFQDLLDHELFHHSFKKLSNSKKEELIKFAYNSWSKVRKSDESYDKRFTEFLLTNYTKSENDVDTFYFLEEYLGTTIASEYKNSEYDAVINNTVIKGIIKDNTNLKNQITNKYFDTKTEFFKQLKKAKKDTDLGDAAYSKVELNKIRSAGKFDRKSFQSWLNKTLPGLTLSESNEAANTILNSNEYYGAYRNFVIYLKTKAPRTTGYHEAFHGVFRSLLDSKQQAAILAEKRKEYPDKSDSELEEILADDFADYIDSYETKPFSKKIKEFFSRILEWFGITKKIDNSTNKTQIEELFEAIRDGQFKKQSLSFKNSNLATINEELAGRATGEYLYKKIPGFGALFQEEMVTKYSNFFIRSYIEATNAGINIKPSEIYNRLYTHEFNTLRSKWEANKSDKSVNILEYILSNVVEEGDVEKTLDHSPIFELLKEATNKRLADMGIIVKGDNLTSTITEETAVESEIDEVKTQSEDSKDTKGFNEWVSIPRYKSASMRLKMLFSLLKQTNKNGSIKTDRFGDPLYVNPNEFYYYLLENLIGINNYEDQITKLRSLSKFRPELKQLINILEEGTMFSDKTMSENLKNEFRTNFSNQHMEFILVRYKRDRSNNFSYVISTANQEGLGREIYNEWQSNVYNTKLAKRGNKEDSTIEINTKVGESILEQWNKFKESKDKTPFKLNLILNRAGINYSEEVLNEIVTNISTDFQQNVDTYLSWFSKDEKSRTASEAKKNQALSQLVQYEVKYTINNFTASFNNVEGKAVFTIQMPSFGSKLMNKLKNDFEATKNYYKQDPIYQYNNLLDKLESDYSFRQNKFKMAYLDGLVDFNHNTEGVKFTKQSPKDHFNQQLGLYLNNSTDKTLGEDLAWYEYLTPSDKTIHTLIQANKYNVKLDSSFNLDRSSEIVEKYYNIFLSETNRIKQAESHKAKYNSGELTDKDLLAHFHYNKKNYNKSGKIEFDGLAYDYHYLNISKTLKNEILEIISQNPDVDTREALKSLKSKIIGEIYKDLNSEVANTIKNAKDVGIITLSKGKIVKTTIDQKNLKDLDVNTRELLAEFGLNQRLFNIEASLLLNGDIAKYKANEYKVSDLQKRTYQSASMTKQLGEGKVKAVAVKDLDDYKSKHIDSFNKILESNGVENPDSITNAYNKVNVTDAQVFITPEFYKDILVRKGVWTKDYQTAFDIAEGKISPKSIDSNVRQLLSAIKTFQFGDQYNNKLGTIDYYQVKCSMIPLFKNYTDLNPLLAKHRELMDKNNVGMLIPESSLKAVMPYNNSITNPTDSDYSTPISFDINNIGIQQENPNHLLDEANSSTRQLEMLILGSIDPNVDYSGTKGSTLIEQLSNLEADNIKESLNALKNELETGKFKEWLSDVLTKREATENLVNSLTIEGNDFKYPLDLANSREIQNMISSIFTKRVIKQEIAGGSAVQATSIGFKRNTKLTKAEEDIQSDLQYVIENDKLSYVEAAMPAWSKDFFDEEGNLKNIDEIPGSLRNLIVYRIPTEGFHSMLPVKVVKFLPETMGNFILLPYEITTQFGSDFDFDKIYFFNYEFGTKTINGEKHPVKIEDPNTKAGRNNKILDIYWKVLTDPHTFKHLIKPSGFTDLENKAKKLEYLKPKQYNFFSGIQQRYLKDANHTGRDLKGQSALHVTGHCYSNIINLQLKDTISINNKAYSNLAQLYNKDGFLIADELSSMMAAILDDIKNPILKTLNINSNTIDIWATLVRLNLGTDLAIDYITQPSIIELSKVLKANYDKVKDLTAGRITILDLQKSYKDRINQAIDNLPEDNKASYKELLKSFNRKGYIPNVNSGELIKWRDKYNKGEMNPQETVEYLIHQYSVLKHYEQLDKVAKELVKLNRFFRINNELGPNIEDVYDKVGLYQELVDSEIISADMDKLSNLQQVFNAQLYANKYFKAYFPNTTDEYLDIKQLIYNSQINASDTNIHNMKAEDRDLISGFISTYLGYRLPFFSDINTIKQKQDLIDKVYIKLIEIKHYANDEQYLNGAVRKNPFIRQLEYKTDKFDNKFIRLKGNRTTTSVKNSIVDGFKTLWDTPETKDFMKDLIKYSYISTGFFKGYNSFDTYIPIEVLDEIGLTTLKSEQLAQLKAGKEQLLSWQNKDNIVNQLIRRFPANFAKRVWQKSDFIVKDNLLEVPENSNIKSHLDIKGKLPMYIRVIGEGGIELYKRNSKNTYTKTSILPSNMIPASTESLKDIIIESEPSVENTEDYIQPQVEADLPATETATQDTYDESETDIDYDQPVDESEAIDPNLIIKNKSNIPSSLEELNSSREQHKKHCL